MRPLLQLDQLDLNISLEDSELRITRSTADEHEGAVAVVGMSGCVGDAPDLDSFWELVRSGCDAYGPLSEERRADVDAYFAARGLRPPAPERYLGGTRMPSVAEFDYRFFGLSRQEAKTIDPHQRIFLQTAWSALEDAGHLGSAIRGSRVGVYVGMSSDFGDDYRRIVQAVAPDAPEISVAGNVKSIIAARLAYLLDLRGPSMLIDTACSSGLVAVYTACRAIQRGECTMAVVGAVNTDLLPVEDDGSGIGIKDIRDTSSRDHRTRTFDRKGDGTSAAEGCVVLVLKSLERAQRDGDNIRALILGGAINQDGASNGITAPNADAQADLIGAALADAGVHAEQISYIEAHGTATRLGDPVEVGGIERAFSRQTTKRQFCGIGTVKTSIGHMDNASGLAGLAKLILSMEHRTLPASLNFEEPNPNLDFPATPLYVNDRTVPWAEEGAALHAGISSFGLSGTNCHLILRSADPREAPADAPAPGGTHILPLSAPDSAGLRRLVTAYRDRVATDFALDPTDVCFTTGTGRMHHRARAAFVFDDMAELERLLEEHLAGEAAPSSDRVTGEFRIVTDGSEKRGPHDISETEARLLTSEAAEVAGRDDRDSRRRLAQSYVRGADIDWRATCPSTARRVPLPTYVFDRTRCWIEGDKAGQRNRGIAATGRVIPLPDRDIAMYPISPEKNWELGEHRIDGVPVLPGTGLVEIILSTVGALGHDPARTALHKIGFATPVTVADGDTVDLQVNVAHSGEITITTRRPDGSWVDHASARLAEETPARPPSVDLATLRARLTRELSYDDAVDRSNGLDLSPRWTESLVGGMADDELQEMLYELRLPEAYRDEIGDYHLHPALLDTLINAPGSLYDENTLYLPFSYGVLNVLGTLPHHVFAHFVKRPDSVDGQLYSFDVTLVDPEGTVLLTVENYCIKSASGLDVGGYGYTPTYRELRAPASNGDHTSGSVLLCGDLGLHRESLEQALVSASYEVVELAGPNVEDGRLDRDFAFGILADLGGEDSLESAVTRPLHHARDLLTLLSERELRFTGPVLALTHQALDVTGDDDVDPGQAGILGMMRIASMEYRSLGLRCIDLDVATPAEVILAEAQDPKRPAVLHYRAGRPFEQTMTKAGLPRRGAAPSAPDGLVIVSGGTGGLGGALARHLAATGSRRIVLLGSPGGHTEPGEWDDLHRDLDAFDVVRIDLADHDAVADALKDLRDRFGRISSVLHLAGRPGKGYLVDKSSENFDAVYGPKAIGAVNLHEATLEDDLEEFVLFSSVSAVLPAQGQADYTAANLVLDSLAQYRRRRGLPCLSLQWPAWREVGMAHRLDAVDEDEIYPPVDPHEALDLFDSARSWADRPVVLMPGRRVAASAPTAARPTTRGSSTERRQVTVLGLEHTGEVERAVAAIWGETLDLDEIDAHEAFADLGGNSLLTSQMLNLYDQRYPGLMDITDLFRYPTISEQIDCVSERLGKNDSAEEPTDEGDLDVDRILELLEGGQLTVAQSRELL